jgi:hypothetical protein
MAGEEFTYTLDGTDYLGNNDGTHLPTRFSEYERCVQCGFSYPKEQMKHFQGKWYGVPCGDFRDIHDIILKQHADSYRRGKERHRRRR